jgi:hypothetical protein
MVGGFILPVQVARKVYFGRLATGIAGQRVIVE